MKKIIVLTSFIFISLAVLCQNLMYLQNDSYIKRHFNKKDIQNLSMILNFFDKFVREECDSIDLIDHCYEKYCEKIQFRSKSGSLFLGFTYINEIKFLTNLDKKTFDKIRFYTDTYVYDKGQNINTFPRTIEMKFSSPYINLCRNLSKENPYIAG